MARTLFFHCVLQKVSENFYNKLIFSQHNVYHKYIYTSFFNPFFNPFSIIAKEVNEIRNNIVCVIANHVFVLRCALTLGRCNVFQHNFGNQKKL